MAHFGSLRTLRVATCLWRSMAFFRRLTAQPTTRAQRIALLTATLTCGSSAHLVAAEVVSFGSGVNQFNMEFVTIGNPGNAADATGSPNPAGSVNYAYKMAKFEVSRDMIAKANAAGNLGITLGNMALFGGNGGNRPATGISWNEAARFVNWLNTSEGFSPAYKFTTQPGDGGYGANQNISLWVAGDAGFAAANPFRNSMARYVLPSVDEWYKAAYYSPSTLTYLNYPTGSDLAPTAVASGTASGSAVYNQSAFAGPANINLAGGLSPYGTMGQGGNVDEWDETEFDLVNDSGSSARGIRGGAWAFDSAGLLSSERRDNNPSSELALSLGFRVASKVPEPRTASMVAGLVAYFAGASRKSLARRDTICGRKSLIEAIRA